MTNLPLACELSTPELARRLRTVLSHLLAQVQEQRITGRAVYLRFLPTKGVVAELGAFMEDERLCCRFLDFRLDVARGEGPVWLRLSGPRGTQRFLKDLLSNASPEASLGLKPAIRDPSAG